MLTPLQLLQVSCLSVSTGSNDQVWLQHMYGHMAADPTGCLLHY